MPRGKSSKLKPFQKLLTIMVSGKEVKISEIETLLGKEIQMYRLSTYMWHVKTVANGIVKSIKDGRKVIAYQLCNVDEIKAYMNRVGISATATAPSVTSDAKVNKLSDLNAKPAKTKAKKEKVVKPVVEDEFEVTEVAATE